MMRAMDRWLPAYLTRSRKRFKGTAEAPCHVFLAVCDHFEPFHHTDKEGALKAMQDWEQAWPTLVEDYKDSSGRGPRHTFFFPIEQYDRDVLEKLAALCARTGSEVEVHLHHDGDNAESLREQLLTGIHHLAGHGLLSRTANGSPRYGFIHGNWALDHSHPDGRHCGVPDELDVLQQTGCYADFTFPSAPDPSQPPIINSIYYANEDGKACSHHAGKMCAAGSTSVDREGLLMVQGPLGLAWKRRKWGMLPRLENADLTGANPPTLGRFQHWTQLAPTVQSGPPWIFVKLHTHGGIPQNYRTLLGAAVRQFHASLAGFAAQCPSIKYHYVTAREMVNLIHAAEAGVVASSLPSASFDHTLPPPPVLAR